MMVTLPAFAALVTPISVSLIAPGGYTDGTGLGGDPYSQPLTLIQSVDYGAPITPGGGDIGGMMIGSEQIALDGDSVLISSYRGDTVIARTGWLGSGADHARYELSGLAIAGRTLTGITVFAFDGYGTTGFTGVLSGTGVSLIDSSDADLLLDTLIFNLDDLLFVDRQLGSSLDHADFRIDITSTPNVNPPPPPPLPPPPPPPNPVPEPGTLLLTAAALVALRAASRRRPGITRPAPGPADGE